jgi:hypothetical protein
MSSIEATFARCREAKRAAFIPYLTGGDPDLETSARLIEALADGGADIIEVGVPFSDPIADGPVNQRAAVRALEAGVTLPGILEMVARVRTRIETPIVLRRSPVSMAFSASICRPTRTTEASASTALRRVSTRCIYCLRPALRRGSESWRKLPPALSTTCRAQE